MAISLKQKGYQSENLVKDYYLKLGYRFLHANWTIPGWEIDLIFESDSELIFIEVKTVDYTEDLENYITKTKLKALERAVEAYITKYPTSKDLRIDVAFLQQGKIIEIYENITNT